MRLKKAKKHTLITNVLFGMWPFINLLKQSLNTPKLDIGTNVEMIFLDISFRELLFYQLIMRSSKFKLLLQ
jgi:hypothetical protein